MVYEIDYAQEITRSIDNNIIQKQDIFEFYDTPFEDLFSKFYSFCRTNLNIQAETEPIVPNTFLFSNSYEVNAGAGLRNHQFLITINLGLLQCWINNYYNNKFLEQYFKGHYPDTFSKFDAPINILAYQVCSQFAYYHELAHLFQFTGRNEKITIQERNEAGKVYDRKDHVLEINADTYASVAISAHIEQYLSKTFKEELTLENVVETVTFLGCCLLNYTLNFSEHPEIIYFDEHDHPHSFIRTLNMLLTISQQLQQSPYFKEKGITIEAASLFSGVVNVYEDLESKGVFTTNVQNILKDNKHLSDDLATYLHSLAQFNLKDYTDAMTVWNMQIK